MAYWEAIGDFAVGHRAIRKIGCLVQKSFISVISIGIGDYNVLTFFSEIRAKIALPEVKTFFFDIRAITGLATLTRKWRPFFSRWRATEHWAMQTFKKHKMCHGSEKVENHCSKLKIALFFFQCCISVKL